MDNNLKFILVDDDNFTNIINDMILKDALGEEVVVESFQKPEEALEYIQKTYSENSDHTILFLDINMPVMNGWDSLKKLKSGIYESIPITMYSTSSARKDIEMAYRLGAILFVTKPEDFRELSKMLGIVAVSSKDSFVSRLRGFENVKVN